MKNPASLEQDQSGDDVQTLRNLYQDMKKKYEQLEVEYSNLNKDFNELATISHIGPETPVADISSPAHDEHLNFEAPALPPSLPSDGNKMNFAIIVNDLIF